MAAFAFVLADDSARLQPLLADVRQRVGAALGERSPGPVCEVQQGPAWGCVAGNDGMLEVSDSKLLVVDGTPRGVSEQDLRTGFISGGDDFRPLGDLDGGFALACYESTHHRLTLARDRFGARPLYWARHDGVLYAGSECKILEAFGVPLRLRRDVLDEVLLCRWILDDRTFFETCRQVPPAMVVTITDMGQSATRRYWRMDFAPDPGGPEAMSEYRDLTRDALRQAIGDAAGTRPAVGVLLSGGIDSSVLAAVARESVGRVIGYAGRLPDDPNPELERALYVARHLGIECRTVDIEAPDLRANLRAHVRRFEEPPRHPNNFVLQQLFARARDDVDLVLQGDAAEMTFGLADVGRVAKFRQKHKFATRLPNSLRLPVARALRTLADGRATRLANLLSWDDREYAARLDTVDYHPSVGRTLAPLLNSMPAFLPVGYFDEYMDFGDALQAYQMYTFSVVSLVRHDRMAQPLGMISESPFLRAPVVDVALRLPRALRFVERSKPVLRALCDFYLPAEVSRWPKLGFPVPWETWVTHAVDEAGGIEETSFLAGVLPRGFREAAVSTRDAEALWTILTLQALAEEFSLSA